MRFFPFTTDIPTAGTRVQISSLNERVKIIHFHARAGNAGNTYVGDVLVSATASGIEFQPNESRTIDFGQGTVLLSTFYVDAATNGDDVDGWALLE